MKKRVIASLLAIGMTASAVMGCGNTQTANEAPSEMPEEVWYETEDTAEASSEACTDAETENWYEPTCEEAATADETSAAVQALTGDLEKNIDAYGFTTDSIAGEEYTEQTPNGFDSVANAPLSTFAADVDTASYANVRRLITQGYGLYDIPGGVVRPEEMINYFDYDYPQPKNGERFGVNAVISECPWNSESKLMILGVNTKELSVSKRPASNIVFLLDISGSMASEDKLPLLKDSLEILTKSLDRNDRVSIVTYASGTNVVLDGVRGNDYWQIIGAFDRLSAGGSTNGEGGIDLAYQVAEENFIKGGNNRVIIGTDGDFNVGKSTSGELENFISEKKESGIYLSVLGFGTGNYSDTIAETLADAGNGNYSYIDSLHEAEKVLGKEMYSTIYTVAKDVKFQVEFNPAMVSSYRQIGYENRALNAEDFKDDTKDGGEVGAGHQVTVAYEIQLANGNGAGSDLKYQDGVVNEKGKAKDEWCTLSVAYKDPDKNTSEYLEFPIDADNYTTKPSDDFIFATSVAEFAMALTGSEYLVDMDREEALDQAIKTAGMVDLTDEYKAEFLELMELVDGGAHYYEEDDLWYE
ncbi:MAG: von Willebrand factor type A domain-containing protein [Lachnospiraceae bacterium]|nr:von Willebrand factor type A domain-containing protein [Lachnospiraceae bacterium]